LAVILSGGSEETNDCILPVTKRILEVKELAGRCCRVTGRKADESLEIKMKQVMINVRWKACENQSITKHANTDVFL
jgi:hypothetical protein